MGLVLLEDLNYILYVRLVLLEHLARDVERQRVAVHDALNEAEVLGQQLVELVGDHHAAHVELQVVLLLVVVLVEVVRRLLGDVQDGLELDLALGREVRVRQRLAEVLGQRLVERLVLLVSDVRRVARPQGLPRAWQG